MSESKYKIARHGTSKRKSIHTKPFPCSHCGKELWVSRYYLVNKQYKNYYCDKVCERSHRTRGIERAIKEAARYTDQNGYVNISSGGKHYLLHRVIMEQHLGRKLDRKEHVHHLNGIPGDNRLENLAVIDYRNHPTETLKKVQVLQARIRELENVQTT